MTQASSGSYFLLGNNTYTGTTTINAGATLVIGGGGTTGALGTGPTVDSGSLSFQRTDSLIVSSSISGSGPLSVFSGGTIILTGSNSYAGQTSISSSTLQIGNGGTSGSLSGSTLIAGFSATSNLVFNRSDAITVSNVITNPLNVIQNGAGTTTLTNADGYTGTTTVNAGTLLVSGSISGGTTTVNTNGTLAGTGTTGAVNVAGGALLPGSSTGSGILKTGNVSFASGSTFSLELGGTTAGTTYSELQVTGTVSLSGNVQISLFGGYTPHVNDTFIVILNDGSDAVSGTFTNAPGNIITTSQATYQVSYTANGDGVANDVSLKVLSVIPEPNSGVLALAGLGLLAGWKRRRAGRRG